MGKISYNKFISSSFFKELQSKSRTTEEFINFVLSFIGVENFVKNHPKPIIEYYWKTNHGNDSLIESLAEKYGLKLKPISWGIPDYTNGKMNLYYIIPQNMVGIKLDENKYPSSRPILESDIIEDDVFLIGNKPITKIEDVVKSVVAAKSVNHISSYEIISNEQLWERDNMVGFHSERHSSDYIEHFTTYKTGWYYLSLNSNIKLDMLLISYLKNKTIALEREAMQEYMAYNTGSTYDIKRENAIMVFRDKDIDENIIPLIINDPLTWEGIFYSENFCNESILVYIKNHFPLIEDLNL